ncbi:MAG TPA: ATP-binding protein [Pyrinomonadaceae bacterium]|jgi:DNA polymerase III delta prime subunit
MTELSADQLAADKGAQVFQFNEVQRTPAEHFKLYFYAAVLHVMGEIVGLFGSHEDAFKQFPFLGGYYEELRRYAPEHSSWKEFSDSWRGSLLDWEEATAEHLPLRSLRESAGLDHESMTLLMTIGLNEEDARFGLLFEIMQSTPGQQRPTLGLLNAWWRDLEGGRARARLRQLQEVGLVQMIQTEGPRSQQALQMPEAMWDAMRGERHEALTAWASYRPPSKLLTSDQLIISDELRRLLGSFPALLENGEAEALVVRGPQHNGRRTLLGALAQELGRGVLELKGLHKLTDERWQMAGSLATLLDALPVVVLDLDPGETAELPRLRGYIGPVGLVLGKQGGVAGPGVERALTVSLEMPDSSARRELWQRGLQPSSADGDLETISTRFRITSGNIQRAAGLAQSYAALESHAHITLSDAQKACSALNRQALDTLAARINANGSWQHLAVGGETLAELTNLESRCRHRERLHELLGENLSAQMNAGVKALFTGPSGSGKTLAARLLAAALKMDLYRLDLSSVVNKYIGETEKNLSQAFARAEELDVILLIDEGDALLTQRTSVQTSNDRYANLETNYLLQRLETFEGILLVTTNASDRIDTAFQRRMDVVVNFRAPDAVERWMIWNLHLPPGHTVERSMLEEIASRCALTGGQIRNAVLHASLLALTDGGTVSSTHLSAAVEREYRKGGGVCPLRSLVRGG